MAYNFKSIADVEVVAEPAESANVLIEENGVIKKAPKTAVGGAGGEADLVFKVGCSGMPLAHPKYLPKNMTKPIIVSGSLEAVLEKMANGKIPVVKVQYQAYNESSAGKFGYGAEYICDTELYATDVAFTHDISHIRQEYTVSICMATDDPDYLEMTIWAHDTASTPSVVIN